MIQGTAGSITKLAAIKFRNFLLKEGLDSYIKITNLVHDEINVEGLGLYSADIKNNLEKIMEQSGRHWCKLVPLKASAKISNYWGH